MTAMQTQYLQTSFCTTLTVCVGFVILSCTTPYLEVSSEGCRARSRCWGCACGITTPMPSLDSLIEEMDSFHREGEIAKMMFLNRRLHQLEIGDGKRLQTSSPFRWKNTLLHYQPTPGGGRRAPKETPPWFSLAILLGTPQFHRRDGKKGQKVSILGAHLRLMSI